MWPFKKKDRLQELRDVMEEAYEGVCEHDWQTVERCHWIRNYCNRYGHWGYGFTSNYSVCMGIDLQHSANYDWYPTKKEVCLKCGECHDGVAFAIEKIQAQWDEDDRREELAAKMWEDCKGE
jgi:hypothetical protein